MAQPLWETVQSFLKNLNIDLLHDPAIPALETQSKERKTLIFLKDICNPTFTAALIIIVKTLK